MLGNCMRTARTKVHLMRTNSIVLAALLLLTACNPAPADPTNIVGNSWLGYQPFYVQHLLYPEQQPAGINMTMLVSDVSVTRMLTNEAAAVAMVSLDNAIALQSLTDLNLCVALVLSSSQGVDAVLVHPQFRPQLHADTAIRVGMEDSALARYVLYRWLQTENIDPARIERRIVLPNAHLSGFETNEFDVIITYAPFAERLEQAGAEAVFTSRDIPEEIIDVVVVRQERWQRERSKLMELFSISWDSALANISHGSATTIAALTTLTELTEEQLETSLQQLHFYTFAESQQALRDSYSNWFVALAEYLLHAEVIREARELPVCEGIL